MQCLDPSTLARLFVDSASERDAIEEHLDGCLDCRELVAAYARASDDSTAHPYAPTISTEAPPPSKGHAPYVGQIVANRYRLERIVGEGGMGVVWAARDLDNGKAVALKIVKDPSPELARRSLREAVALARVGHPSLIEVQAVVSLEGSDGKSVPVLVMPLLEGESLDRMLARRGQLDEAETIAILEPVVGGMCAAHARGVIHRDLKPPNVFLAEDRGERVVVVLDFGLAKLLSPDGSDAGADKLTRTGALLGTPFYMAPEQLFGEGSIDGRADVWAIGVMLYECLSGKKPVEGRSYGQIAKNVAASTITPLDVLVPSADPKLCRLAARMLEKEREQRPDLLEVHAVLASLLHARPRA